MRHTIPLSEYESAVAADGIVNLAVVMKDTVTEERVLEIQEFNLSSPKIDVEVQILASGVVFLLFFFRPNHNFFSKFFIIVAIFVIKFYP